MFTNPRDPNNTIINNKITEWVLAFESIPQDAHVHTREVTCNDPGCNHTETHILIEGSNNYKKELIVRKPLVYIRKWDIVL
jgi:hypothetical protein